MTLIASDKQRIIVGLGATGLSCARFFQRQGLAFAVVDSRAEPPQLAAFQREFPDVELTLGPFQTDQLSHADELVVSPGVPLEEPAIAAAIAAGAQVYGDIDLFMDAAQAPVVAITGSNGKSTVTTLVGAMAAASGRRVAMGGNLGTPALDLLTDNVELYVLELSSFQLERTASLRPAAATVLNVSPDHMDRYASLMAYYQAKQRIYRDARHVVFNRADALTQPLLAEGVAATSFGLDRPDLKTYGVVEEFGERWLAAGRQLLLPVRELGMNGAHNVANALAALALGNAVALPQAAMVETLKRFTGLPHRCQLVADFDGVRYYDDSKGTNVGATVAAIKGLCPETHASVVLIAGGVGKGAAFDELAPVLGRYGRAAVLIGEAAPSMHAVLENVLPLYNAADMAQAVAYAAASAQPGDAVLLSPACASFDMFRDYVHRGDVFAEAARSLGGAAC